MGPRPAELLHRRLQVVAVVAGDVLWRRRTAIRTATGRGVKGYAARSPRRSPRRRDLPLRAAHPQAPIRTSEHHLVLGDPLTNVGCGSTRIRMRMTMFPEPQGMLPLRRRRPSPRARRLIREQAPSHRHRQQNLARVVLVWCSPAPRSSWALQPTGDRAPHHKMPVPAARLQTAPLQQVALRMTHPQNRRIPCPQSSPPPLARSMRVRRQVCTSVRSGQEKRGRDLRFFVYDGVAEMAVHLAP